MAASGDVADAPERTAWLAFGEEFGVWDVDYLERVVSLAALYEWVEYRKWKFEHESSRRKDLNLAANARPVRTVQLNLDETKSVFNSMLRG